MKLNRTRFYLFNIILAIGLIVFATSSLKSSSAGKTGSTSSGCGGGGCHTQNSATTLAFSNSKGSWTVNTGETIRITVTITNAAQTKAGCNIAVKTTSSGGSNTGTITNPTSGFQIQSGEVTHSSAQNLDGSGKIEVSFDWQAPTTAGTYYVQAAGNAVDGSSTPSGDQWNTGTQAIIVQNPPSLTLTAPMGGGSYCPGGNTNITWTQNAATQINITLSSDGGNSFPTTIASNIPAVALSYAWSISSSLPAGNQYRIKITDANNSALTSQSTSNFSLSTPTAITKHPTSMSACTGTPASFDVDAVGGNLTYQWKFNGNNINGATSKTLTIPSVFSASGGEYTCEVSGACGNPIISNMATLTVTGGPAITAQPLPLLACVGGVATFVADASGPNLTLKWQKNGIDIPNSNSKTLTISNVANVNEGSYRMVATSAGCSVVANSNAADLTITDPPLVTTQPVAISQCENTPAKLYVNSSGNVTGVKWYKNGVEQFSYTSKTITFTSLSANDAGAYYCVLTGLCSPAASSATINVDVNTKPVITTQPTNKNTPEGTKVTMFVVATSNGANTTYQWKKGSTNVTGATSGTLTFNAVALTDAGDYTCVITNDCGNVVSNVAKLTVSPTGGSNITFVDDNLIVDTLEVNKTYDFVANGVIKNTGTKDGNITALKVIGPLATVLTPKNLTFPMAVKAGESKTITFDYKPNTRGTTFGELEVTVEGAANPIFQGITATAFITDAPVTLSKSSLEAASEKIGQLGTNKVGVQNNGTYNEKITNITFSDNKFTATSGLAIAPSKEEMLDINYTPTSDTDLPATASIYFEAAKNPITLQLLGKVGALSVEIDENLVDMLNVSPNPSSDFVNIKFENQKDFTLELSIIDLKGNLVKSFGVIAGKSTELTWNCTNELGEKVSSGSYIGIIKSNGKAKIFKIEVSK